MAKIPYYILFHLAVQCATYFNKDIAYNHNTSNCPRYFPAEKNIILTLEDKYLDAKSFLDQVSRVDTRVRHRLNRGVYWTNKTRAHLNGILLLTHSISF